MSVQERKVGGGAGSGSSLPSSPPIYLPRARQVRRTPPPAAAPAPPVRNFPNSRGFVVGILKGFLGLSASVYASVYAAFFAPDAITFLLVLACCAAASHGRHLAGFRRPLRSFWRRWCR